MNEMLSEEIYVYKRKSKMFTSFCTWVGQNIKQFVKCMQLVKCVSDAGVLTYTTS